MRYVLHVCIAIVVLGVACIACVAGVFVIRRKTSNKQAENKGTLVIIIVFTQNSMNFVHRKSKLLLDHLYFLTDSKAVAIEMQKKPETSKPVTQDPTRRPLTFKQILETDITPQKEEYLQLKELDMRKHVLIFSNSIAKRYSGSNRPDAPPIPKLNRYFFFRNLYNR